MRLASLVVRSLLAAALIAPATAFAQEAAPAADSAAPAESAGGIEEIVVTAQKRAQSVQDVPVSVAAIGGDDLERFKVTDTNDLAGLVPNLQVNQINGDGAPVFAVRGITMNDYSVHQSSPIAVYTDEVYTGPTVLQPMQMFDLERIEVLRGPQGTLYGRNTTGGAVNLVTRAPSFEGNGGDATLGAGNFDRFEARGAANLVVVDDVLAVRFAGMWADADGWFKNRLPNVPDNNSTDEWAIRVAALWRPTDTVEVTARFSSGRSDPTNYGIFADNVNKIGAGGVGAGVYASVGLQDYFRTGLGKFELESNGDVKRKREVDQAWLTVNWELTDTLTLTSVTSWTQGDFLNPEDTDGSPLEVLEIDYAGDGDQIAQDLRLTSSFGGAFDFVAGFYYANEDLDIATDLGLYTDIDFDGLNGVDPGDCVAGFPAGCVFENDFNQERRSIAGYFDGTYALNDTFTLLFGVRVTNDRTEANDFRTIATGQGAFVTTMIPSTDDSIEDTEFTGKLGLEMRVSDDLLTYFTYNRGYRSGAFNGQAFFDPSEFNAVKPETLDAVELGWKSTLGDGMFQLNGALFYYLYKDQQLIDVDSITAAQTLVNIEKSRVFGLELEGLAQVNERWRLNLGLGWLNGEARKGIVSGINVKGDALPNSPDFNVQLGSDLDLLETSYGTLAWRIDANYVGEQYFTLPHVRRVLIDNYVLFNTRIDFRSADGVWEGGFWMKNLANEFYQTSAVNLVGFGYDYTHIGPPRTFGADVTFHF